MLIKKNVYICTLVDVSKPLRSQHLESPRNIPQHVAIIMDGNGRWATAKGNERIEGHRHGVDSVREVVAQATKIGVKYLTIYAFSTENWGRPVNEVDSLMELIAATIITELQSLTNNGVKLQFIGQLDKLPQNLKNSIEIAQNTIPQNVKLNLVIALNYGAHEEITLAVKNIATQILNQTLKPEQITPQTITQNLWTKNIPNPDLLIRTSGEQRLSNFLLWQLCYTELFFTQTLWPEFNAQQFMLAICEYQNRQRRFGLLK